MGHWGNAGGLKREEGMKDDIPDSESLIRWQQVETIRQITQKFRVHCRVELRGHRFTEKKRNRTLICK